MTKICIERKYTQDETKSNDHQYKVIGKTKTSQNMKDCTVIHKFRNSKIRRDSETVKFSEFRVGRPRDNFQNDRQSSFVWFV